MSSRRALSSVILVAALALPVSLSACGDLPADGATSSVAGATKHVVSVNLESVDKVIHAFGADDAKVAGMNHLTGEGTDSDGTKVQVELLALVDYVKGSGSFDAVLTLTFPDSSTITARLHPGTTTATADATTFASSIEVLGGTGAYLTAVGSGTFAGSRTTELGGAVQSTFTLSVATS